MNESSLISPPFDDIFILLLIDFSKGSNVQY